MILVSHSKNCNDWWFVRVTLVPTLGKILGVVETYEWCFCLKINVAWVVGTTISGEDIQPLLAVLKNWIFCTLRWWWHKKFVCKSMHPGMSPRNSGPRGPPQFNFFFIFTQFSAKILPNNRFVHTPLGLVHHSGKSWIRGATGWFWPSKIFGKKWEWLDLDYHTHVYYICIFILVCVICLYMSD